MANSKERIESFHYYVTVLNENSSFVIDSGTLEFIDTNSAVIVYSESPERNGASTWYAPVLLKSGP